MLRRLTLLQDRLDQEQREKVEFQKEVSGILEGNRRLKEEVKFLEDRGRETSPFATPDGKQESKPKEAERPPKEAADCKEADRPPKESQMLSKDPTIQVILKLMEGMQEEVGAEWRRRRCPSADLPRLADWSPDTAPIDYNDWLLCLGPQIADLSPTSEQWWSECRP